MRITVPCAAAFLVACSTADRPADATVSDAARDASVVDADAPDALRAPDAALPPSPDCDPLDPALCAMPWPSNLYLVDDPTRSTGHTLTFGATSLPRNMRNSPIDPSPFTLLDGYGVGTPVMTVFPDLDVSTMATEDHIERSVDPSASAVLLEITGSGVRRVPYFVELDRHENVHLRQTLFLRPAEILREGTRYIVAFRNLRDTHGSAIEPSPAFLALRNGTAGNDPLLAPRIARFESAFAVLAAQGIARESLTLAWDFNTASNEAMHGRMLAMRDEALPTATALTVTDTTEYVRTADSSGRTVDPNIAFEIHGTFTVPDYTHSRAPAVGRALTLDADNRPRAGGVRHPEFWIRVPWSAIDGGAFPLVQYGHGLFGSGSEVRADYVGRFADEQHFIVFAATLTGMSNDEVSAILDVLTDASNFTAVAGPLHQGLLEWLVLGRAARTQFAGLAAMAAHHVSVDTSQLFYTGNSQGGIFGASYVALSFDITRAVLGVPGNNYVTLLQRSADFAGNSAIMAISYRPAASENVAMAAMQLSWDATDPVGYYRHLAHEPFANTPAHTVLLGVAKADHQVAVLTDEIVARTADFGIPLMEHYDTQRTPWNVPVATYPHAGSGVVLWDFGNPWPAIGNTTPYDMLPDPHELPRRSAAYQAQMAHYFLTGEIEDVCGGDGCHPD